MLDRYGLDMVIVNTKFSQLKNNIQLVCFSKASNCLHCHEAEKLFEYIAELSPKIEFEVFNFDIDKKDDSKYEILDTPAVAIIGKKDFGIRYYCYPQSLELNNFLDDIVYVSTAEHHLSEQVMQKLGKVNKKIQLKVFISPWCSYSLPAARMALKLAIASEFITVAIIDISDFMQIAEKYSVQAIPMTVINEIHSFYGALDELHYVDNIMRLSVQST
jgi:glutaredoxin-like protein